MLIAYRVDQCELIREHVLIAYKPRVDQCELIRAHVLVAYKPEFRKLAEYTTLWY